jgi:hypothetical protein
MMVSTISAANHELLRELFISFFVSSNKLNSIVERIKTRFLTALQYSLKGLYSDTIDSGGSLGKFPAATRQHFS